MSLLEYFKRKEHFPDPTGPLASVPLSFTIVRASPYFIVNMVANYKLSHEHRNLCETPFIIFGWIMVQFPNTPVFKGLNF